MPTLALQAGPTGTELLITIVVAGAGIIIILNILFGGRRK